MNIRKIKTIVLILLLNTIFACDSDGTGKQGYLNKGIALFNEGKLKESELEIKNAIQEDPKSSEAYYYLALLYEKGKKYKAMESVLLESVKYDPNNIKAGVKLSKVYLLFNQIEKAGDEIDRVLVLSPEDHEALVVKASILMRLKKEDEALKIIDSVLNSDADNIDAISLKTALLIKNELFDQALVVLTPALEKHSDNISLHVLKIQIDSKRNDINSVIAGYKKLIELKPDNVDIKNTLAKVYIQANEPQKAENFLRRIIKENPGSLPAHINLLNFLNLTDENKALSELNKLLESNKDNNSNLIVYSKWLIGKDRIDKAKGILAEVVSKASVNQEVKNEAIILLARLEFINKAYERSLQYVDGILNKNPEDLNAGLLKAEILSSTDEFDKAIELLEKLLRQHPKSDRAMSQLGSVFELQGELDKAFQNYKDALNLNPKNLQALNFIVKKEVDEQHVSYAIELLERTLRYLPTRLSILTKLVELEGREKHWELADKYIERIKKQSNGLLLSNYLQAKILSQQNKFDEANTIFKDLLKTSPWLKDALLGLAENYHKMDRRGVLTEYLDQFVADNPTIATAYILKSQILSDKGKSNEAIKFLKEASITLQEKNIDILLELARVYAKLGKKDAELDTYKDAINIDSNNIELLIYLASYYEAMGQYDKAVDQYLKVLTLSPRNKLVKNNLASLYLDHYSGSDYVNKAVQLTQYFKQARNAYYLDSYGWAQLKQGNINEALSIFKKVVVIEPNVAVFRYHLGQAYYQFGDVFSAKSELKQALYLSRGKSFTGKKLIESLLIKIDKS